MRPLFLEILVTAAVAAGDQEEARLRAERARQEAERLGLAAPRAPARRTWVHLPPVAGVVGRAAGRVARPPQRRRAAHDGGTKTVRPRGAVGGPRADGPADSAPTQPTGPARRR